MERAVMRSLCERGGDWLIWARRGGNVRSMSRRRGPARLRSHRPGDRAEFDVLEWSKVDGLSGGRFAVALSLAEGMQSLRWPQRQEVIDCMVAIMREKDSNSRTTAKLSPPKAVALRAILDFESFSRSAPPSKQ